MNLPVDLRESPEWSTSDGPEKDVVVSSRLRYARNVEGVPFPGRASKQDKDEVFRRTEETLSGADLNRDLHFVRINELNSLEKEVIQERRLGSQELAQSSSAGLAFDETESVAVLVNEEDHFRIQALRSGYNLSAVKNEADRFEQVLGENLGYAYDEEWGYLTACPTNVGTGLRASVLLHLPGLILEDEIGRVLKAIANLGLTVRGYYGEGTESQGFYLQLSNQVTLGQSVGDLIDSLRRVTERLVSKEREARNQLLKRNGIEVKDQVWRSYGTLKHARRVGTAESLELLSYCRLGVDIGLLDDLNIREIDELLIKTQPAHLNLVVGNRLSPEDREAFRSEILRNVFADLSEDDSDRSTNTLGAENPED